MNPNSSLDPETVYPYIQGLQNVALGHTLAFDVIQGEFIQVLHNGQGHWVTISTIGCQQAEVDVFDSLFADERELNKQLQSQIAALLHTDQDVAQQQEGRDDCGIFAVAFAAVL